MNKKIYVALALLLVVTLVVGIYLVSGTDENSFKLDRFKSIPEKPNDFDAYTRDIWKGQLTDLCEIEPEYYLQPDFYGDSWDISKSTFYDNPDYSRWGVYGQGNMPKAISYTVNMKEGDQLTLCSFFHNGFGIWTYQGFQLYTDGSEEFFDVEVTPNLMTMNPTFPVFEDGWVRKIEITLTAKKDIPEGEYNINLRATGPTPEYSREELKRILHLEIDKEVYYNECVNQMKDEEGCRELVNLREKKYVDGGAYQTSQPLLSIGVISR